MKQDRVLSSTTSVRSFRLLGVLVLLRFGDFVGLGGPVAAAAMGRPSLAASHLLSGEDFLSLQRRFRVQAAERHVEIGVWCRDAGLVAQAGVEFTRAADLGGRDYPRAQKILSIMGRMDQRFWKKVRKNPSASLLKSYAKKSHAALDADLKARLKVAGFAFRKGQLEEARAEYLAVLRENGSRLEFDRAGLIKVRKGTIPLSESEAIRADAVAINGDLYLRDEILKMLPDVSEIYQADQGGVRVRSLVSGLQAEQFCALSLALCAHLESEFGAQPTSMLSVFVFAERADYERLLDGLGLASHKAASGVANANLLCAIVCAEGVGPKQLEELVLHEFTHLFEMDVTRSIMPSWYREGVAELYGGKETFRWDGKKLSVGGRLASTELAPIQRDEGYLPLGELLAGNALNLLTNDKQRALRFYAESWALMHFFEHGASRSFEGRYRTWLVMCRGQSLGRADAGKGGGPNASTNLFLELFRDDLGDLETEFRAYLRDL